MATSSITANFEIKDTKTARAFVTALLSPSRPIRPPAVSRVVDGYVQARCQPLELTLEDMHEVCRLNGGLAA